MLKKIFLGLLFLFLLFCLGLYFFPHRQYLRHPEDVIYQGKSIQISASACPLQTDALSVEAISPKSFVQWDNNQHHEAYNLLENAATLWREQEFIDDFMVIGTTPPRMHSDRFFWEIIPFPKTDLNFLDQFLVVFRLTFDSPCLSQEQRQNIHNKYQEYVPFFAHVYQYIPEQTKCPSSDPFCDPKIIEQLLLYEGKWMNLLYNHAPLGFGDEKLHFLIIPKAHRTGFPELTLEEYTEAQQIAQNLINYYAKKNFPIVYLFHKTGKFAGQTVPHWHEHVVFAPNESYEFWGQLQVMRKMLFPSRPLPPKELEELVNKYRSQIKEAMQTK